MSFVWRQIRKIKWGWQNIDYINNNFYYPYIYLTGHL